MTYRPITAYLDTAIWNNLADGQADAARFEQLVATRKIEVILSFTHMVDFSLADKSGRRRRGQYLDRITAAAPFRWLKDLEALADLELQVAFYRYLGLGELPRFDPLASSIIECFRERIVLAEEGGAAGYRVSNLIEISANTRTRPEYLREREAFSNDMEKVRDLTVQSSSHPRGYVRL